MRWRGLKDGVGEVFRGCGIYGSLTIKSVAKHGEILSASGR